MTEERELYRQETQCELQPQEVIENQAAKIERLKAELEGERRVLQTCSNDVKELEAQAATLRKALETALGMLDDPTGGEHVRDMRSASHVIRQALATDAGKEAADVLAAALEIDGRSGDKLFAAVQAYRAKGQAYE